MPGTWDTGLSLSRYGTKGGWFFLQPAFTAGGAKRNSSNQEVHKAAEQQETSQMLMPSPGKQAVLPTSRTLS